MKDSTSKNLFSTCSYVSHVIISFGNIQTNSFRYKWALLQFYVFNLLVSKLLKYCRKNHSLKKKVFIFGCLGLSCSSGASLYLKCMGLVIVEHRLSCPVACGILVPWPGIKTASPALEDIFLTNGPPGKSQNDRFYLHCLSLIHSISITCTFLP